MGELIGTGSEVADPPKLPTIAEIPETVDPTASDPVADNDLERELLLSLMRGWMALGLAGRDEDRSRNGVEGPNCPARALSVSMGQ